MRARAIAVAVLSSAFLATSAPYANAGGWLPPNSLESGYVLGAEAAITTQGETIVIWRTLVSNRYSIRATSRPPGGSFGPVTDVTAQEEGVENMDLNVDPAGGAILTWRGVVDSAKDDIRLFYSYRPPEGSFTPAREVAGAGKHVALPETAVDAQGNALTVFVRAPGGDGHLAYVFRPAGGEYGGQQEIANTAASPQVAFAGDGTAVAAWTTGIGGLVRYARRPPGGDFGVDEPVSINGVTYVLQAVSASGRAVLAWQRYNGSHNIVEAALAEPGAGYGPAAALSTPGSDSTGLVPAIDPAGVALVSWVDGGAGDAIRLAAGGPGNALSPAIPQLPGTIGFPNDAQFAGDGSMMLLWQGGGDPNPALAALRSPAGALGPSTFISPAGSDSTSLDLGGDAVGNFIAVAAFGQAPDLTLQASGYDGVPPAFRSLSVPAKAKTGKAASFSANTFDVFGSSVDWKFGDGRSSKGPAVQHIFKDTGGRRTIVVTATDPAGQSTVEHRTVEVKDVTPVVISRVKFKPAAFAPKDAQAAHGARVRKGSNLRFRLSEPARVRIAFERRRKGRYVRLRSKPLKRKGKRGGNRVKFRGKIGGARLTPGRYRAALVATDSGGLTSKTKYASFTIVSP